MGGLYHICIRKERFLGHSTSEITELFYMKKDTAGLNGITDGFEL
jgi:hypothetical protein